MRLVITRPLPDGEPAAALLRARGHEVLLAPLMRIEPVAANLSGAWSGIVVTSANALNAVPAFELRHLPVFAVGARTAAAARERGFVNAMSADGDARDLVRLIANRSPPIAGTLLYLSGENRAADLEAELTRHGVAVTTKVVYRAIALAHPLELAAALKNRTVDGVLHYSARSAMAFLDGASMANLMVEALALRHFCLSEQIAAPLRAAGAALISVAATPTEDALIDLTEP